MVWTVPITFYDGDPLTAAQLNTYARDNFIASEAGVATIPGRFITTVGTNQVGESQWARSYLSATIDIEQEFPTTEDNEGVPLGPTVTVQHNGLMWIMYDARVNMNAGNGNAMYAPQVDGQAPENTSEALRIGTEGFIRGMGFTIWTGEPGLSEVTMAYGVSNSAGRAGYAQRRLTVIPF